MHPNQIGLSLGIYNCQHFHEIMENYICLSVLLIYQGITNYPQTLWFKTTHMFYLTGSVSQESEHTLARSASSSLTRLQSSYWPGLESLLKVAGRSGFQDHLGCCWQVSVL